MSKDTWMQLTSFVIPLRYITNNQLIALKIILLPVGVEETKEVITWYKN